jgi:anti-sigma regulatory factor (Ser/Thr protein kinase)
MGDDPTPTAPPERPPEFIRHTWPAHPRQLAPLRTELRRWLAPFALSGNSADDLVLAVNEAAANSVEHAYLSSTADKTVELILWAGPSDIWIEIIDRGTWLTPSNQPSFRGRGIEIMNRLAGFVLIHHDNRGTRVLLRYSLSDHPLRRLLAPTT